MQLTIQERLTTIKMTIWRKIIVLGVIFFVSSIAVKGIAEGAIHDVIKVKDSEKQLVVTFKFKEHYLEAYFQEKELKRKVRDNKSRYMLHDHAYAKVKHRDNTFKVSIMGDYIYKVYVRPDKLKIKQTKDEVVLLEVKDRGDKYEVFIDGVHRANIQWNRTGKKIKIKSPNNVEMYSINGKRISPAYGLMLLSSISNEEKYVMLMELLASEYLER